MPWENGGVTPGAPTTAVPENSPPAGATSAVPAAGGGTDLRSQVYTYLTDTHKLSPIHAKGIMANIDRESSFRPSIASGDDGGAGGLFQWFGVRQTPEVQALVQVGDWRGQIDYALSEPTNLAGVQPGLYAGTQFGTAQEAADWWMNKFERPADPVGGSQKHSGFLSTYNF